MPFKDPAAGQPDMSSSQAPAIPAGLDEDAPSTTADVGDDRAKEEAVQLEVSEREQGSEDQEVMQSGDDDRSGHDDDDDADVDDEGPVFKIDDQWEEEEEESGDESGEDTASWDPLNGDSESKIASFSLPTHLKPVAGKFTFLFTTRYNLYLARTIF